VDVRVVILTDMWCWWDDTDMWRWWNDTDICSVGGMILTSSSVGGMILTYVALLG
jgi:hypothetical protein